MDEKIEYIKKQPSRALLRWLDHARKTDGIYSPDDVQYFTIEEIKEELSTREHIPSKLEAKLIRQQKAKSSK